jgi:hypothetical protein
MRRIVVVAALDRSVIVGLPGPGEAVSLPVIPRAVDGAQDPPVPELLHLYGDLLEVASPASLPGDDFCPVAGRENGMDAPDNSPDLQDLSLPHGAGPLEGVVLSLHGWGHDKTGKGQQGKSLVSAHDLRILCSRAPLDGDPGRPTGS